MYSKDGVGGFKVGFIVDSREVGLGRSVALALTEEETEKKTWQTHFDHLYLLSRYLGFDLGEFEVQSTSLCLACRVLQLEIHVEHRAGLSREIGGLGFGFVVLGSKVVQFAAADARCGEWLSSGATRWRLTFAGLARDHGIVRSFLLDRPPTPRDPFLYFVAHVDPWRGCLATNRRQ